MQANDQTNRVVTKSPWKLSFSEWRDVAMRSWRETGDDNIGLIAAGVSFYGFLALVPLLGAIVLSYGLLAEPNTVVRNMQGLTSVMPADAAKLVGEQLMNVVKTSGGKKGFGVFFALVIALYGARNGAGSVITALNVAYEEKEKRGFLRINFLALAITAAAVGVAIIALIAIAALGHLEKLLPGAPNALLAVGKLLSYVLLGVGGAGAAATLYRYGPSRENAKWAWISPGSVFSALCWLVLTLGFGVYVAKFGNYNATYGSLGAVVVLLTWLYLSSYVLLFGAELNSEIEGQASANPPDVGTQRDDKSTMAKVDQTVSEKEHVGQLGKIIHADAHRADETAGRVRASPFADLIAGRVGSICAHAIARGKPVGMATSVVATIGLSLLRRPGRAFPGAVALALAATAAWLMRETE